VRDNDTIELHGGATSPAKSLVQTDRTRETYKQLRIAKKKRAGEGNDQRTNKQD
jgi:hypothetical protein